MKKNEQIKKIERLCPDVDSGLSSSQVLEREAAGEVNISKKKYSKSYLDIFFSNIFTFFNLLGLIVVIALIAIQAPFSRFFFAVIYLCNIVIGITQEIKAKRCIDRLTLVSSDKVKVVRDGNIIETSHDKIVLDDILIFKTGNAIPVDCVLKDGEVEVNESMLTGESVPVKKKVGDFLLAGSFITSGSCISQADKIGANTYAEKLSEKAKSYKKPYSELMTSLRVIIKVVGIIILPVATAFMIKSAVFHGETIAKAIDGTATVVIGMIPSGMFLLTSLALAVGIIKLYKKKTLVQDLYSLEMLARVDTICFDKTGTLTDGKMTVKSTHTLSDTTEYEIKDIIGSMLFSLHDNNQTAIALSDYYGESGSLTAQKTLPFSSVRKLSAVSFTNGITYSFGAPEFVLNKEEYVKIAETVDDYAKSGFRVLVLAKSELQLKDDDIPKDFSPVALIVIMDNVRKDAAKTIKWFNENDVDIKVISGDNPITVSEVAKRSGIKNAEKYISLDGMSEEEVYKIATEYTVFGRVSPEQKACLLKSLKDSGHTTAMTGDGVNDILALKEADCAITVAEGTEAAKNVSHLVLMDNNFDSMPQIVYEGRRVINNVQCSSTLFLMKTLFTLFFALITLIIPSMRVYPFNLSQMIIIEVFVIGVPSFFLSLQPNDSRVKGRFISTVLAKSLPSAILMIFGAAVIIAAKMIFNLYDSKVYTTLAVYAITFAGLISLFNICMPLNKYRAVLYFTDIIAVLAIMFLAITKGLLSLETLIPVNIYWHHYLLIVGLIIIDYPLLKGLEKLCVLFLSKIGKRIRTKKN